MEAALAQGWTKADGEQHARRRQELGHGDGEQLARADESSGAKERGNDAVLTELTCRTHGLGGG